jgi:hypothetical protein
MEQAGGVLEELLRPGKPRQVMDAHGATEIARSWAEWAEGLAAADSDTAALALLLAVLVGVGLLRSVCRCCRRRRRPPAQQGAGQPEGQPRQPDQRQAWGGAEARRLEERLAAMN